MVPQGLFWSLMGPLLLTSQDTEQLQRLLSKLRDVKPGLSLALCVGVFVFVWLFFNPTRPCWFQRYGLLYLVVLMGPNHLNFLYLHENRALMAQPCSDVLQKMYKFSLPLLVSISWTLQGFQALLLQTQWITWKKVWLCYQLALCKGGSYNFLYPRHAVNAAFRPSIPCHDCLKLSSSLNTFSVINRSLLGRQLHKCGTVRDLPRVCYWNSFSEAYAEWQPFSQDRVI